MKTSEPQSISTLLKKYNLRPRKSMGQNFLVDPFHLAKIIEVAELTPADIVLEIGPGPGALTRLLAEAAGYVIAVELDPAMVNLLQKEYGHLKNLTIVEADILQTNLEALIGQAGHLRPPPDRAETSAAAPSSQDPLRHPSPLPPPNSSLTLDHSPFTIAYKVVANLPYYITSAVLRHLLEARLRPQRLVVTVQKEVAQRMVAGPGQMSLLAVSVQFYGQPVLMQRIPAGAFYPPPRVDSAVVRIDTFARPRLDQVEVDHFFRVVKAGFGQKRKQLKNSLAAGLGRPVSEVVEAMAQARIDPARRAETLSLAEWERLAEVIRR